MREVIQRRYRRRRACCYTEYRYAAQRYARYVNSMIDMSVHDECGAPRVREGESSAVIAQKRGAQQARQLREEGAKRQCAERAKVAQPPGDARGAAAARWQSAV